MALTVYLPMPPRRNRRGLQGSDLMVAIMVWAVKRGIITQDEARMLMDFSFCGGLHIEPNSLT